MIGATQLRKVCIPQGAKSELLMEGMVAGLVAVCEPTGRPAGRCNGASALVRPWVARVACEGEPTQTVAT
jgi:hypothetical protein